MAGALQFRVGMSIPTELIAGEQLARHPPKASTKLLLAASAAIGFALATALVASAVMVRFALLS